MYAYICIKNELIWQYLIDTILFHVGVYVCQYVALLCVVVVSLYAYICAYITTQICVWGKVVLHPHYCGKPI